MTATHAARLLVDELVACGVREAVLAPGSRNAPISYALAAADERGALRLHVRIDERSAAFLALGLAKASGRPVPVCCTSGTAAANFGPAVLEASESGVPLVVLTADRPPELRGVGANQTIVQAGLYGGAVRSYEEVGQVPGAVVEAYVRSCVDRVLASAAGSLTGDPGPVHLNVPLREPLTPGPDEKDVTERDGPWTSVQPVAQLPPPVSAEPERTMVIVGDAPAELGRQADALAERHGWPLISEPSGGARGGPMSVPAGTLLLGVPDLVDALLPERVVVVGRPTLTRSVQALLRDPRVQLEVRSATTRWADPGRRARSVAVGLPDVDGPAATPSDWASRWLRAGRAAAAARDALLDAGPMSGLSTARAVAALLPAGAVLMVGSSLPVRDLDLAADDLSGVTVLANRGVAGIDGTVSTAIGIALASPDRPAYAMIGDLTFLHDQNGLVIGPSEPRPDLCLVVVDNDGGGIFGTLEQGAKAGGDAPGAGGFERIFGTPVGVDLQAACATTGTGYLRVGSLGELKSALVPATGVRVVHVPVPRADLGREAARLRAAVEAAVGSLI